MVRKPLSLLLEVGGRLYAVGGFDGAVDLGTVERYDPKLDVWEEVAAMATPRAGVRAWAGRGVKARSPLLRLGTLQIGKLLDQLQAGRSRISDILTPWVMFS